MTSIWQLNGTPSQQAVAAEAIRRCDFPFERLRTSLAAEGKSSIAVDWEDLSRRSRAGGDHDHTHEEGVHAIERVVEGRKRVLGLFYLPPHTRVVLDTGLEGNPDLAYEVMLAEGAHAVDYHYMVSRGLRAQVWNAIHGQPLDQPVNVPESGDIDHGHSWFDGPGGYSSWVGEAFMEGFIRAFAPGVPVTIALDHPIDALAARLIRQALLGKVYRGRPPSMIFHDSHKGVTPFAWFETAEEALRLGYRPCKICKPR